MLLWEKYNEPHVGSGRILLLSEFKSDVLLRVRKHSGFQGRLSSELQA